jgi:hypothetical protein
MRIINSKKRENYNSAEKQMGQDLVYRCRAIVFGSEVDSLLKQRIGVEWNIHSVFRKVVNLQCQNDLLSLVCPGMGNAPNSLVVDLPVNIDFTMLGIKADMPVTVSKEWMSLGKKLVVDFVNVSLWKGRSPADLTWSGCMLSWANLTALWGAINRWGVPGGLVELITRGDHSLAGQLRSLARAFNPLVEDEPMEQAVNGFLGYGPGLTPSGDDLLLGVLAAAVVGMDYHPLLKRLEMAITANLKRTNDLSAFFLRRALVGDYHEYLQEAIFAVARGLPGNVTTATRILLGVGATSGTDMAVGLYLAFYWRYQKGERRQDLSRTVCSMC